jgi:hypothetical protein
MTTPRNARLDTTEIEEGRAKAKGKKANEARPRREKRGRNDTTVPFA